MMRRGVRAAIRGYGKKKKGKVQAVEVEGDPIAEMTQELEDNLQRSVAYYERAIEEIEINQGNDKFLRQVRLDDGSMLVKQSKIYVKDGGVIMINPTQSSLTGEIEKSLRGLNLDLGVEVESGNVLVTLPDVTQDVKDKLKTRLSSITEEVKQSIRNHRRQSMSQVKSLVKSSELSKDLAKKHERGIDQAVQTVIQDIESLENTKKLTLE